MLARGLLLIALSGLVLLAHPLFAERVKPDPVAFGSVKVSVNNIELELEHAVTFEQRARGLMYRSSMCENCGMLFSFSRPLIASIWMKNTFIPLDLAYIDSDGFITGIYALEPHNLASVQSKQKVSYAIEMNQGWFAKNEVKVGDKVVIDLE